MADDERVANRLEVMARGEDGLMHRVEATSVEEVFGEIVAGCADALAECRAERDRLRVIVDLACAEHEAKQRSDAEGLGDLHYFEWCEAQDALREAVAAEVARRAQV